jgi:hypothetical protein
MTYDDYMNWTGRDSTPINIETRTYSLWYDRFLQAFVDHKHFIVVPVEDFYAAFGSR